LENVTQNAIWRITYTDDTRLWQKDPKTGKEHTYEEIDQDRIKFVDILKPVKDVDDLLKEEVKTNIQNKRGDTVVLHFKTYHNESLRLFRLEVGKEERLILFRRVLKNSGGHVAVLGELDMLIPEKRAELEKKIKKPIPIPQQIQYPLERKEEVIFLIGWQRTVGDTNIQSICYLYPDGHVEMKHER
jgi:hypothetical protein